MARNIRTRWVMAMALLLSPGLLGSPAAAGPVGVVDNFSVVGLGEYTLTRVLDNGVATANVSFSDASGALVASYTGTPNQPEQVLLLRSSATLGIGESLVADVSQATSTSEMDFGLAASVTVSPTGVSDPTPTDTRSTFDWLSVSVRPNQNAIRVNTSISGVVTTASFVISNVDETTVSKLFIQRTTSTNFTVGYFDTGQVRIVANATPITFASTNVGAAIGFYADLRADLGTLGSLDNLRIEAAPVLGDVTGDGLVTIADFNIIKANLFNTSQTRSQGDLTNDGIVDFADFRQWKSAAGSGFGGVTLFGVPEPGAILLSSIGGCCLMALIRRRRALR